MIVLAKLVRRYVKYGSVLSSEAVKDYKNPKAKAIDAV